MLEHATLKRIRNQAYKSQCVYHGTFKRNILVEPRYSRQSVVVTTKPPGRHYNYSAMYAPLAYTITNRYATPLTLNIPNYGK